MSSRINPAQVAIGTAIPPQSVAAAGNAVSGWMSVGDAINIIASINVGALGGGSVGLSWDQAVDASGTSSKALSAWGVGSAMASNNATQMVENDPELLDINNSFAFVRAKLTVTGGTGALVGLTLHKANPRIIS